MFKKMLQIWHKTKFKRVDKMFKFLNKLLNQYEEEKLEYKPYPRISQMRFYRYNNDIKILFKINQFGPNCGHLDIGLINLNTNKREDYTIVYKSDYAYEFMFRLIYNSGNNYDPYPEVTICEFCNEFIKIKSLYLDEILYDINDFDSKCEVPKFLDAIKYINKISDVKSILPLYELKHYYGQV